MASPSTSLRGDGRHAEPITYSASRNLGSRGSTSSPSSSPPPVPRPTQTGLQSSPRQQSKCAVGEESPYANVQSPWHSSPSGSPKAAKNGPSSGAVEWLEATILRN